MMHFLDKTVVELGITIENDLGLFCLFVLLIGQGKSYSHFPKNISKYRGGE